MMLARFLLAAAIAFAPAFAQHEAPKADEHAQPAGQAQSAEHAAGDAHAAAESHGKSEGHGGGHEGLELWKWANFLLLAGGLGYLIGKNAGPFFASRSQQITKDMAEADRLRQDAEARSADVDRRLGNLQAEIDSLRSEALNQQAAEAERIRQHTTAEIQKIQEQAEQEIASAGKAARTELKRYSAELALELAERKLRAGVTPESQDALVQGFVQDLGRTS